MPAEKIQALWGSNVCDVIRLEIPESSLANKFGAELLLRGLSI
ncbi:MAG: hypothetical protein CM15mP64_7230 [Candidatus Neomarinimicrobiota bacterium]|nr:MAG: hypothetical protein CM15mP64_7230 [Candidatus Neomarinimicrobiota bacterium]